MEYAGNFEKAAGLTFLYHADLGQTIECLNSSRSRFNAYIDERLMLVAAALAGGFSQRSMGSKMDVWKSLVRNLSYQLQDPYLRALFALMASDGDWLLVLGETSLPLTDRMVMALRFLNDHEVCVALIVAYILRC